MNEASYAYISVYYLGICKVEIDGFGMSDVEDSVGLGRKSCDDLEWQCLR